MSIIENRVHAYMQKRSRQLILNTLAIQGGTDYVRARLWRAPNESDLSWYGDTARGVVGRIERTALVNDAGRVANKINQYIFSDDIQRTGGSDAFFADVTGDGEAMDVFMERVNTAITAQGWCWVQVDRAPLLEGGETLANKPPVRLKLWDAQDVVDWSFDDSGGIRWLITKSTYCDNSNPRLEPVCGIITTLWERTDDGAIAVTEECSTARVNYTLRTGEIIQGLREVPFILIGRPTDKAWWFDDVERIQAQILNLDSMHNETLTENVYPQLVLPLSLINSLESTLAERKVNGESVIGLIRELTVGRKTPVIEAGEDKGISRYIMPSGDCKLLTDEATRKRALLFDTAGLALFSKETRQVQTAESKRFDQLDTNSTLGNRARILDDAERRIAAMVAVFDPSVGNWQPQYPADFDVVDAAALADSVMKLDNMPSAGKVAVVRRFILKAAVRVAAESAGGLLDKADIVDALKEIDAIPDDELMEKDASTLPDPFDRHNDENEDEDDEENGGNE